NGDVDIAARVASLANTASWAKAGVMIRESPAANRRQAFALVSAAKGSAFPRRIDSGGLSVDTLRPAGTAPGWVRLVRTGHRFEAFVSADGQTWTSIGVETIPMSDAVYV